MNWYQSGVVLTLAAFGALVFACTSSVNEDIVISGTGTQTPAFGLPDASPRADGGGVCPSNECPPGHATCPDAPFLCSVDLSSDDDNCGECGNRCFDASKPENQDSVWAGLHAKFVCVDSACQFGCANLWADCNGYAEDGCEANLFDKEHCGACNKACQENERCDQGTCVCDISDSCGKCGNICPEPEAPPFPYEWNA